MSRQSTLDRIAYEVADLYRSRHWPELKDDGGGKEWRKTWQFLTAEIERRCPGFTHSEYEKALEGGLLSSK